MMTVNTVAITIIVLWAFWCLLSPRVSDGIIGKVLYLLMMLAALAVLSNPEQGRETNLNMVIAAIGIRHFWMKTYWPGVREYLMRHLCRNCPHKPE